MSAGDSVAFECGDASEGVGLDGKVKRSNWSENWRSRALGPLRSVGEGIPEVMGIWGLGCASVRGNVLGMRIGWASVAAGKLLEMEIAAD
jgi:hypothetical protein